MEHANGRADGVAIRRRSSEAKPHEAVSRGLIVSEQDGWTVVRGHEQIDVAVAVEVGARDAAADARLRELASSVERSILERAAALIEE